MYPYHPQLLEAAIVELLHSTELKLGGMYVVLLHVFLLQSQCGLLGAKQQVVWYGRLPATQSGVLAMWLSCPLWTPLEGSSVTAAKHVRGYLPGASKRYGIPAPHSPHARSNSIAPSLAASLAGPLCCSQYYVSECNH